MNAINSLAKKAVCIINVLIQNNEILQNTLKEFNMKCNSYSFGGLMKRKCYKFNYKVTYNLSFVCTTWALRVIKTSKTDIPQRL